ncbi:GNAT family N-acetyltransferase [Halorubellus sp. JP-L1]|uniref:GNAT family N-acetyltransferase n=1 Tax=Halorubellus sp. JP-L1 TaxID=2715753 RepID=UPI00140DC603|nr:GNAT family N-acetyltransferase [Halorubellus sp. JP-L1]NHN41608.1 GNAT family N-acetyltransferase [Halorubellus sp. JP-L1]
MHPAVTIRPATFDDVAGIQRVARAAYHAAYGEYLDADALDAQLDEWYGTDGVENRVLRDASTLLVADHDADGVVGYASGGPTPTDHDDDQDDAASDGDDGANGDSAGDDANLETPATLYTCYVHPDHWGERVGHRLLERVADRLRDRGFEHLRIPVLADNDRARQFYVDHGYPKTDTGTVDFAGRTLDEVTHAGPL